MVLLMQSLVYIDHAWAAASWTEALVWRSGDPAGVVLFWSQQALVAVYFTSGLFKLWKSGHRWVPDSPRIVLQIIKSTRQVHYTRLGSGAFEPQTPGLVGIILRHPHATRVAMSCGLALEVLSPLFLLGRLSSAAGGCLLLCFHYANHRFMGLGFRTQAWLVAILLLDLPHLATLLLRQLGAAV